MCSVICRKSTFLFPMPISVFPVPLSRLPEYKIGIFVRFLPSEPSFSGFLSTKSVFLCQKEQFSPGFCPFRAQNRGFCALIQGNMASGSRKARKFLFLHAFKLLLPLGHCRQSTWAPGTWNLGTGAPWHRSTVKPWNRGTACGGTAPRPERSLVMPTLA